VVPFEELDRRGERTEQRVGRTGLGDLYVVPADLRLEDAMRRGAGDLGQKLAPKADTQNRNTTIKGLAQKLLLGLQPWVLVVLIDMHRAPEDEQSVGHGRRRRLARHPGRKLTEHPRPGVQLVNDRKHPHSGVT
jgi:hypothetical protein